MEGVAERVRRYGVNSADVQDLLAVGFSRREADGDHAARAANRLLARINFPQEGALSRLGDLSSSELGEHAGLEGFEAIRTLALLELGRRIGAAGRTPKGIDISDPESAAAYLDYLRDEAKEHFVALLLDAKNRLLRVATIHIGTLTMSVVGGREVFREAIREGACSIIVAHNHPSGDPEPSPEDYAVTRTLVEAGKLLEIPVLDHVVIGHRRSISLRARRPAEFA